VKTISVTDGRAESLTRISYKISEAAQIVGVSPITIRRAINRGLLKPCRKFRHPLIPADQLRKLVEVD
jgi:predicted site-specific integrase-resolvase